MMHSNMLAKVPTYCVDCDEIPGSYQAIPWVLMWIQSYIIYVCSSMVVVIQTGCRSQVLNSILQQLTSIASSAGGEQWTCFLIIWTSSIKVVQ